MNDPFSFGRGMPLGLPRSLLVLALLPFGGGAAYGAAATQGAATVTGTAFTTTVTTSRAGPPTVMTVTGPSLTVPVATSVETDPASGIRVAVSTPLDSSPTSGFLPVRVEIVNGSAADGVWRFRFPDQYGIVFPNNRAASTWMGTTDFTVAVPAGQTKESWLFVPALASETTLMPVSGPSMARAGGPSAALGPDIGQAIATSVRQQLIDLGLASPTALQGTFTERRSMAGYLVEVRVRQQGIAPGTPMPSLLPPGFDIQPGPAERTFIYRENIWMGPGVPDGTPNALGKSTIDRSGPQLQLAYGARSYLEAAARLTLDPTGLLNVPASVRQSIVLPPRIVTVPDSIVFTQRGPESDFPPIPRVLPPGVTVNRHRGATPSEILRTIAYAYPAPLAAQNPNSHSAVLDAGRHLLTKHGFLGGASSSVSISGNAISAGGSATFTFDPIRGTRASQSGNVQPPIRLIFTESGPADQLPEPGPGTIVPLNAQITVAPGAGGSVVRTTELSLASVAAVSGVDAPMQLKQSSILYGVEVSGPGIDNSRLVGLVQRGMGTPGGPGSRGSTPPLAISADLEAAFRSKLALSGIPGNPTLAVVDPKSSPADWRFWSSFNAVILAENDYRALDVSRRGALRTWVAFGGRVVVVPGTSLATDQVERIGAGEIRRLARTLEDLETREILGSFHLATLSLNLPETTRVTGFQALSHFGEIANEVEKVNLVVGGVLIGFALVVGPLNFFWLAPARRRYRLFLTTPILALLGGCVLMGLILLQDGVGGSGARDAVVTLVPGENTAAVTQVQISKTGLLGSTSFQLPEEVNLAAIGLSGFDGTRRNLTVSREGDTVSGDWFANRWRQAQFLRQAVPTRGRVEHTGNAPDGAPIVESTVAGGLKAFVYIGADGEAWTASEIPAGQRVTLKKDAAAPWGASWYDAHFKGSDYLKAYLVASAPREPGGWLAMGGASEIAPIETLQSIDWTQSRVAYIGTVLESARPGAAGGAR